jgi:hypothetical protein
MWNIKVNIQLLELDKKTFPTSTIRNNFSGIIEEKYPHHIKIFIDASKSLNGTGFASGENNKSSMLNNFPETSISYAVTLESKKILIIITLLVHSLLLKTHTQKLKSFNPFNKNDQILKKKKLN